MASVYETNQFNFDKLVPWLRHHVTHAPGESTNRQSGRRYP